MPSSDFSEVAHRRNADHSTPGTVMGTVGYMSPSRHRANQRNRRALDIFSFAAFFLNRNGQKPFRWRVSDQVVAHGCLRRHRPRDFNPAAPAALQRIVRRCFREGRR